MDVDNDLTGDLDFTRESSFDGALSERDPLELGEDPLSLDELHVQGAGTVDPDEPEGTRAEDGDMGGYLRALRHVPLLTAEEERVIGGILLDSRGELTRALGQVPALSEALIEAWREALSGERHLSDVLQWPLGSPSRASGDGASPASAHDDSGATGGGPSGRLSRLESLVDTWRGARGTARPDRSLRRDLAAAFEQAGPAFSMLSELRRGLEALARGLNQAVAPVTATPSPDRALSALASRNGVERVARQLDVAPMAVAAARDDIRRIEAHSGTSAAEVRAAHAAAKEAEGTYKDARTRMFESNVRLVFFMAGKFARNAGLPFEDLVQEGNIGLLRAIEKFDHRLGFKFSTYASNWIWQATTRALAERQRVIRVPTHVHDKILRLDKVAKGLEQSLARKPTIPELARESDLPEKTVKSILEVGRPTLSLEAPVRDDDGATFKDLASDERWTDGVDDIFTDEVRSSVEEMLDSLPPREALILRLRHGIGGRDPHTLEEVGAVLGITRERTRQLQNRAIQNLRSRMGARGQSLLEE